MREDDENLLNFCVKQKINYKQEDWLSYKADSHIKIAALILSCDDDYGRKQELKSLCNHWSLVASSIPEIVKASRFDIPRFISMLQKQVSLT